MMYAMCFLMIDTVWALYTWMSQEVSKCLVNGSGYNPNIPHL